MTALTFSAFGHRWRVCRLANEPLPTPPFRTATSSVTGLFFESDTASSRFLPLQSALLPAQGNLGDVPLEQWKELLGWAAELDRPAE